MKGKPPGSPSFSAGSQPLSADGPYTGSIGRPDSLSDDTFGLLKGSGARGRGVRGLLSAGYSVRLEATNGLG
ncbi:hypothetical protein GCM10009838_35480 [Catenulispora subtropica]|uniref:Uncharacterized protein n=1 Tax=Catenulispora subtropica TaxID=450798 RepID=A0ABN2RPK4_9ACTN